MGKQVTDTVESSHYEILGLIPAPKEKKRRLGVGKNTVGIEERKEEVEESEVRAEGGQNKQGSSKLRHSTPDRYALEGHYLGSISHNTATIFFCLFWGRTRLCSESLLRDHICQCLKYVLPRI